MTFAIKLNDGPGLAWLGLKNGEMICGFDDQHDAARWLEARNNPKPKIIVAGNVSDDFKAKLAASLNGGRK